MPIADVLTPEEVTRRFYPVRSQLGGLCETELDVTMKSIPSDPYTDNEQWYRGFIFKIGNISYGISAESLINAGYDARKIPLLLDTFKRFEEQKVSLKVVGSYRTHNQTFDVNYEQTLPYVLRAINQLKVKRRNPQRKPAN